MKKILLEYIGNEFLSEIIARVGLFALEMIAACVLWRLCWAAIERYRKKEAGSRADTISALLKSALKYIIYFFALVAALDTLFNVNVMSILAAAGVVGVALAFGAQSVVKDVITGFFIIFEGAFQVGDLVTINDFTGTVESITLRCTTLRNYMGDVYIIPNGSVDTVLNRQHEGRGVALEVSIAYESDINRALEIMARCCAEAAGTMEEITGEPKVQGGVAMCGEGVRLRVLVPCVPGSQYAVEFELLKRVKYAFDENGIEIYHKNIVKLENKE